MDTNSINQTLRQPEGMKKHRKTDDNQTEKVSRLLGHFLSAGLSVAGIRDTFRALVTGQVEELVIGDSFHISDCEDIDILNSLLSDASSTGEINNPQIQRLLIADALVRCAQRTGARVTFIEGNSLMKEAGGIGAFLRRSH